MKSLLHTITFLGTTYNFYIDDFGSLEAATIPHINGTNSKKFPKEILKEDLVYFIEGLPPDALHGLNNWQKMQKVKQMLEECYPKRIGLTIYLTLRGRGGWGEDIHRGYKTQNDDKWLYSFFKKWCIDYKKWQPWLKKEVPEKGAHGTYTWVKDLELCGKTHKIEYAEIIARFDNTVDFAWETNPINFIPPWKLKERQSWHFNTNWEQHSDMSECDSRFQHGIECLTDAVKLRKLTSKCICHALQILGKGLHPLQDIFAHIGRYVTKSNLCSHHLNKMGKPADDPYFICPLCSPRTTLDREEECQHKRLNQRYSDTKTLTYLYLLLFRLTTEPHFINHPGSYIYLIQKLGLRKRVNVRNRFVFLAFAKKFRARFLVITIKSPTLKKYLRVLENVITEIFDNRRKNFASRILPNNFTHPPKLIRKVKEIKVPDINFRTFLVSSGEHLIAISTRKVKIFNNSASKFKEISIPKMALKPVTVLPNGNIAVLGTTLPHTLTQSKLFIINPSKAKVENTFTFPLYFKNKRQIGISNSLAVLSNKLIYAYGGHGPIKDNVVQFDMTTWKLDQSPISLDGMFHVLATIDNEYVITSSSNRWGNREMNGLIKIWKVFDSGNNQNQWKEINTLRHGDHAVEMLRVCYNTALGKRILISGSYRGPCSKGMLYIWNLENISKAYCIRNLDGYSGLPAGVAVLHGKYLAALWKNKTLKIWDMQSWQCISSIPAPDIYILHTFGDQFIGAGVKNRLNFWEIPGLQKTVEENQNYLTSLKAKGMLLKNKSKKMPPKIKPRIRKHVNDISIINIFRNMLERSIVLPWLGGDINTYGNIKTGMHKQDVKFFSQSADINKYGGCGMLSRSENDKLNSLVKNIKNLKKTNSFGIAGQYNISEILPKVLKKCCDKYQGSYKNRIADAQLTLEAINHILGGNIKAIFPDMLASYVFLAHLNSTQGVVGQEVENLKMLKENLEGWQDFVFLFLQAWFLFDFLIRFNKGKLNIPDFDPYQNSEATFKAIVKELCVTIEACKLALHMRDCLEDSNNTNNIITWNKSKIRIFVIMWKRFVITDYLKKK